MSRIPLFLFDGLESAVRFARWASEQMPALQEETRTASRHALLVAVEPVIIGRVVHLRLSYETGDAAGQNMTTACAWRACNWLRAHSAAACGVEPEEVLVEGNLGADKKAAFAHFAGGRGTRVVAECRLTDEVARQVLKASARQMARCNAAGVSAAVHAGTIGYNINVANGVAAMFTALGQDVACTTESSIAQLHVEETDDGSLYASLTLPSLIVGTVGGGTALPAQAALLDLLGCAGRGNGARLAEIVAGFCLALDLSTMAAVSSGEFARAHERLGRNRPARPFRRAELTPALVQAGVQRLRNDPALTVERIEPGAPLGASITTELTSRQTQRDLGVIPLRAIVQGAAGVQAVELVAKIKAVDVEIMHAADTMSTHCGGDLAAAHARFRHCTGYAGSHLRESGVYRQDDLRVRQHTPALVASLDDPARDAHVLVLERVESLPGEWTAEHTSATIDGLARLHSVWLGRERELTAEPWMSGVMTATGMGEAAPLWSALLKHAHGEFPALIGPDRLRRARVMIAEIGSWWHEMERMPRTLVHNDCSPRNLALVREPDGDLRLSLFDWELATVHVPQRDLAEVLASTTGIGATPGDVTAALDRHRTRLEAESGIALDPVVWRRGYRLALQDLLTVRLPLLLMAHTFRQYDFIEPLVKGAWHLLDLEIEREGTS